MDTYTQRRRHRNGPDEIIWTHFFLEGMKNRNLTRSYDSGIELEKGRKGTNRDPGVCLDLPVGTAADWWLARRGKRTAEPLAAPEAEQPAMAAG